MVEKAGTTVLVVDDEPSIQRLFAQLLARLNFNVLVAHDGREGLEMVNTAAPDLVITDLSMPGMDGYALLESMARERPDTPVIVLSGADDMDAVIRSLRLGAWDFLRKPLENKEILRNTLRKAFERSRLLKENRRYQQQLEEMVADKTAEILNGELRFRTMADFAYDWECWLSPQGELVYTSPSCERVTGYSVEAFKNQPDLMLKIVHIEDQAVVAGHLKQQETLAETCQLDFRIVTRSGEIRWIDHHCRRVYDAQGTYQGLRISNRDITRRMQIQKDLKTQRSELVEKSKHLEMANHALKAMLDHREIERHSIEASILANLKRHVFPYTEQLAEMNLGPRAHSYLQIIKTNIEELITPLNPTLSTAYQTLTPVETSVADLIRLGKGTKEIANLQHISPRTVAIHRNKIRKKLGLVNSNTNLQTYLKSLS